MNIRKATQADLPALFDLYAQAREFMKSHGNPNQWGDVQPPRALVEENVAHGDQLICEENGALLAAFAYLTEPDPTYFEIYNGQWLNDAPYGVVHRLASARYARGAAAFCLDWALAQCGNLRIDTHRDNYPMQNLLKKLGYTYCGIIYQPGNAERIAFQKLL